MKKWLRKWLGIEENASQLARLEMELSLIREALESQISQLRSEVEEKLRDKVGRDDLEEILSRIDELEHEVRLLEKYSLPRFTPRNVSKDEDVKQKILDILSARGEMMVTELQLLSGVGWKKFYKLLKELEKEGKIVRLKKKGRVLIYPRTGQ